MSNIISFKKPRTQTAQQKLNNFLRSDEAKTYPFLPSTILVLTALASYFYYNETCYPSISCLQEYCLLSKKVVTANIKKLEAWGLIGKGERKGSSTVYTWKIPEISDAEIYKKKPVRKKRDNVYKLKIG